jgi:hypothetical protein
VAGGQKPILKPEEAAENPGRCILRLLEIVEEPTPPDRRGRASPGRSRDRRRLDAEVRRQGQPARPKPASQREATPTRAPTWARNLPAGLRPVKPAGWKVPA